MRTFTAALMTTALAGCWSADRPLLDSPSPLPTGEFILYTVTAKEKCNPPANMTAVSTISGEVLCPGDGVSISEFEGFYRLTSSKGEVFFRKFLFVSPVVAIELRSMVNNSIAPEAVYVLVLQPQELYGGFGFDMMALNCRDAQFKDLALPIPGSNGACLVKTREELIRIVERTDELVKSGQIGVQERFRLIPSTDPGINESLCAGASVRWRYEDLLTARGVDWDEGLGWAYVQSNFTRGQHRFVMLFEYEDMDVQYEDMSDKQRAEEPGKKTFFLYDNVREMSCPITEETFNRFKPQG